MSGGGWSGPGSRVLCVVGGLVPWARRDAWRAEWEGELAWQVERLRRAGAARPRVVKAVLRVLVAALSDAVWLRLRHGRVTMLGTDVRQGVRGLVRQPGFALAVVGTLALGIGGVTAVVSVLDAALFRPLPYAHADRLVDVWQAFEDGSVIPELEQAAYRVWREQPSVFERLEATLLESRVVTGQGEPRTALVAEVTPGVFDLLGVAPMRGRVFTAEESAEGGPPLVVVHESFWRSELGSATSLGQQVVLDGVVHEVIGVMPESFRYPRQGRVALYVPLRDAERPVVPVGRLRDGLTPATASAAVDVVAARLAEAQPREQGWDLHLIAVAERQLLGQAKTTLWLLAGAVLGVLLIGCVNVANLMLVRGTARSREMAVRGALGATRGRLVRQLMVEACVLAGVAGGIGVLLASTGVQVFTSIAPQSLVRFSGEIRLDARVMAFAFTLTAFTAVLFGIGPAVVASRRHARLAGSERLSTADLGVRRVRGGLAIAELALAMTLLACALLLMRSLRLQLTQDPGYDADAVLVLDLWLPHARYPDGAARGAFHAQVVDALRGVPGVTLVSLAGAAPPAAGFAIGLQLHGEGQPVPEPSHELVPIVSVDEAYFDALGIARLDGRTFDARDVAGAPAVAVIDRGLAERLWPGERAVGKRFRISEQAGWLEVVGVVESIEMLGATPTRSPQCTRGCDVEIYRPIRQSPVAFQHSIVMRTAGDPASFAAAVREAVWALDPTLPLPSVQTGSGRLHDMLFEQRFVLRLMAAFTIIGLLLAAIGVYGVLAWGVSRRTREIGVRVALGAHGREVMRDVLRSTILFAAAGTGLGVLGAVAGSRLLSTLLIGVAPTDPYALGAAAALLMAVSALAAFGPARRALRISPLEALRVD